MQSAYLNSAREAPPILFQSARVQRRIAASDSVASLVASLAYGEPQRSDLAALASVTTSRVSSYTGAHS